MLPDLGGSRGAAAAPPTRPDSLVPTEPLSDIAIQRELGRLPGWARRGGALTKTFTFRGFTEGIAFVVRVADVAEAASHFPDIDVRQAKVTVSLRTHDGDRGITEKDVTLAHALERASVVPAPRG
jgi:4a-hydroxytetrahydrobiopterin dehydratase